jgi:hypothetical protein
MTGSHSGARLVSGDLTVFLHEASDGQWLNIKVAGLEIPFAKDSRVVYRGSSYIWPAHQEIADLDRSAGDGYIELTLLPSVSREQRDMFTSILQTWCSPQALGTSGSTTPLVPAQPEPFPEDMRVRRFVLAIAHSASEQNQVLMLNEEGEVIGDLAMPVQLDGDMNKAGHEQDPVVVEVSGSTAHISPLQRLTSGYGQSSSKIVSGAEYFSRGLITAAEKLSTTMATSSSNYAAAHPVPQEPLVFHPAARKGICGLLDVSNHAATISSKTFGLIGNMAGSAGGKISNAFSKPKPPGAPPSGGFRGALRNSLMALNTVIESVEASCVSSRFAVSRLRGCRNAQRQARLGEQHAVDRPCREAQVWAGRG